MFKFKNNPIIKHMLLLVNMFFHESPMHLNKHHPIMAILSCRNTHQTMQINANLYKIAFT